MNVSPGGAVCLFLKNERVLTEDPHLCKVTISLQRSHAQYIYYIQVKFPAHNQEAVDKRASLYGTVSWEDGYHVFGSCVTKIKINPAKTRLPVEEGRRNSFCDEN